MTTFHLEQVRAGFTEACPGTQIQNITELTVGRTSRQWLVDTDEGPLMFKVPVRQQDPDHFRHLIAATRLAAQADLPVPRFRAFLPTSKELQLPVLVQEYVAADRASDDWKSLSVPVRENIARTLGRWIGVLHTVKAAEFTDVFGRRGYGSPAENAAKVLKTIDDRMIGLDWSGRQVNWAEVRRRIQARFAKFGPITPRLCHHDVWLENVLLRDEQPVRLLDFEHARYSDQYAEFGKIQELLFEWWPETEQPFLAGYQELHPFNDESQRRMRAHTGLYNVRMCWYFSQYQPDLVPAYLDRIAAWVETDAATS